MITVFPTEDRSPDRLAQAVWIDLKSPEDDEIAEVERATGLKVPSREDVSTNPTGDRCGASPAVSRGADR